MHAVVAQVLIVVCAVLGSVGFHLVNLRKIP